MFSFMRRFTNVLICCCIFFWTLERAGDLKVCDNFIWNQDVITFYQYNNNITSDNLLFSLCWFIFGFNYCIMYFQITEIYNFTQDDLMTEDIFILDCHSNIFIWVGQQADSKSKLQALSIGEV